MIYVSRKDTLANLRAAIELDQQTVTLKSWDARALYVTLKASTEELIGIEPEGPVEKRRAPRRDKGVAKKVEGQMPPSDVETGPNYADDYEDPGFGKVDKETGR